MRCVAAAGFGDWLITRCAAAALCESVSERGRDVHAHLQPHLHDAVDRALERLSPVSHPHAAGVSAQHMGRNQRAAGPYTATVP